MNFYSGQSFEYASVRYRVRNGNRCEGDLVIEFSTDGGRSWHRPAIAHTLILIDFKYQVEENNYGALGKIKRGGLGGWKLLQAIMAAVSNGWESEAEKIKRERAELQKRNDLIGGQLSLPG